MTLQCENCQSMFFKTLETRILPQSMSILYKRRCKRCKCKYIFRQETPDAPMRLAVLTDWEAGLKVSLPNACDRPRIFISEYSQRISGDAERSLPYLRKIRKAQERCYESP